MIMRMRTALCINSYSLVACRAGALPPQARFFSSSRYRRPLGGFLPPVISGSRQRSRSTRTASSRLDSPAHEASASTHTTRGPVVHRSQSPTHLDDVEDAVTASLLHYQQLRPQQLALLDAQQNILQYPPRDRETIGVASNLQRRLRGLATNGDCRRCWLQQRHCVCGYCVPLEDEAGKGRASGGRDGTGLINVNRLFLLTHHKEICLAVDTAKLILTAFPATTQLVVSGIGREFQPSMGEMLDAVSDAAAHESGASSDGDDGTRKRGKCLILFPTEDAKTFDEIREDMTAKRDNVVRNAEAQTAARQEETDSDLEQGWDVVVLDGTWSQARKMHAKYFGDSGGRLYRVQLSADAVRALDRPAPHGDPRDEGRASSSAGPVARGHQLRRHPIKWREISTLEATRLLLNDMHTEGQFGDCSKAMAYYQEIGNDGARRQLGPPRARRSSQA